jgi:hypothetical protein
MRRAPVAKAATLMILMAGLALAPDFARAGVPRSCIHPWAHAIECPKDTRRVLLKVLPSARRRALGLQRPQLEWTIGTHQWERNELLRQIRDGFRDQTFRD